MNARVYLFHRVSPAKETWALPMSPEIFEKCIKYISQHYHVCTVEDFILNRVERSRSPKPVACITLDDGFKDNVEYAAPILKKYRCPASFYIVTDCVDHNLPTWNYLYRYAFLKTKKLALKIDSYALDGKTIDVQFDSVEERIAFGRHLYVQLKDLEYAECQQIIYQIHESFNDCELPHNYIMSWDDIRQLHSEGHMIGSHTKTHSLLTTIHDDQILTHELYDSATRIQEKVGTFPLAVAYPVGYYDERVMQFSTKTGYQLGLAVGQRFYTDQHDQYFDIPRMDIYAGDGWFKTYMRLTGTIEKVKTLLRR